MSIVTKMIVKADAETRYPTPEEIEQIKSFIMNAERRLRIVQTLTSSRQRIVQQTGEQLFQKQPRLISPGGNAYGQQMTATCLRARPRLLPALAHLQYCSRRNFTH